MAAFVTMEKRQLLKTDKIEKHQLLKTDKQVYKVNGEASTP